MRHYLGSTASLTAARKPTIAPGGVGRDSDRILREGLQMQLHCVVLL